MIDLFHIGASDAEGLDSDYNLNEIKSGEGEDEFRDDSVKKDRSFLHNLTQIIWSIKIK